MMGDNTFPLHESIRTSLIQIRDNKNTRRHTLIRVHWFFPPTLAYFGKNILSYPLLAWAPLVTSSKKKHPFEWKKDYFSINTINKECNRPYALCNAWWVVCFDVAFWYKYRWVTFCCMLRFKRYKSVGSATYLTINTKSSVGARVVELVDCYIVQKLLGVNLPMWLAG